MGISHNVKNGFKYKLLIIWIFKKMFIYFYHMLTKHGTLQVYLPSHWVTVFLLTIMILICIGVAVGSSLVSLH